MLAQIPSSGPNPRGSPDFLAYPVPKAYMHVLGTGVPRCLGVACSASSPKAAQALERSLTPGIWISFGPVTCMARAASVPGLWTLGFLLLHGACVWVWVVLELGFRLRPATPGCGVGVPVRLCVRSACTPPLPGGVCSVGVCALVRVSAAVRVCVCLSSRSACTPPLLAGVCGVGVCAWARVFAAPCLSWVGCWGVRLCVRAPLVPHHSWLGCAAWVCVLGVGFWLRPANPGWGVGVRVCSCARYAWSPPLLAGVCSVAVCAWARVSAAPRHSWPGCQCLCLLVCALRLYPANPGWVVRCGCVCFC